MEFFSRLFNKKQPEDDFKVSITEDSVKIEHPKRKTEQVEWNNIKEIKLINTDSGPWLPDVWLALISENDGCLIPQGAQGYDEVYEIVSKYEGFNFENVMESMSCTDNAEFNLWNKLNTASQVGKGESHP
ncbi:hypothetical protein [uncultured Cyclobacterium sp.]|uniref:hypothetical protein n=1 Tax=uncultured Cyclobacterium sp. TaxID=453820 RepID=UPI0030EB2C55|tara:strand:+ start:6603 stop:6992 length:390 start_codon:yes stop_codon:yes gene_type:complete